MAYDEKKDVVLWSGRVDNLMISVQKYADGAPKFQIGPRVITKATGEESFVKAGRLTAGEFEYISTMMPEIKKALAA